ncbi:hypothetical protein ACTXT7_006318 [Hymenolepis weldensis]
MVREGVKMTNIASDSATTDSGPMPTRLANKIRILLPNRNLLNLVYAARVGISLSNVLSSSIDVYSAERLHTKEAVSHRPPQYFRIVYQQHDRD